MTMRWTVIGRELWESVDMGGGGGGGADPITEAITGSMGGGEGAPPPAADPNAPSPEEEQELAALAQEFITKNPKAVNGRIDIPRHQAVLTRTRNQHTKAIEEWAAKEKAWQEKEAAHTKQAEEWKQYEWAKDPEIHQALKVLALSEENQEEFAKLLLSDERYAKILQLKSQEQKPAIPSDRPRPNKKTEDGTFEYWDEEGVNGLLDWHGKTLEERLTKQITDTLTKQMEEKYGKVASAYEQTTQWNKAVGEQKVVLDKLRADLKGFQEHEKEIKAHMEAEIKAGRQITPREAWAMVVVPKLEKARDVNEAAMRDKIMKELNEKRLAADGVVKPKGVEKTGAGAEVDIADVIRASIRRDAGVV